MAKEKCSLKKEFTKGLIKENPVLRLVLGTCPTLATSTSMVNAIGMGVAATIVLVCSNIVISALRKIIPDKVRIPAYVVIIASFVTLVQMLVKAFVPALDAALGVFLPLIVVNCIILGRAEMYASKNGILNSFLAELRHLLTKTLLLHLQLTVLEWASALPLLCSVWQQYVSSLVTALCSPMHRICYPYSVTTCLAALTVLQSLTHP